MSAVLPQLEVLEATWGRLHGICGASNAEELITYWTGKHMVGSGSSACVLG